MKYLDLYLESISKSIFSGKNFFPGIGFITFSFQSETGQSGCILPYATNSNVSSSKTLKISKSNIIWWAKAWKQLFDTVQKENKEDLLLFYFSNSLLNLKNKEAIWIIPHVDYSQLNLFFKKLSLKLRAVYSSHVTDKDPFLGKINYAIYIRKNFPISKILDTIGEQSLQKFYLHTKKKNFEGDIKQALQTELEQNSDKEILDGLAEFFSADKEDIVLNLFQNHLPFSKVKPDSPSKEGENISNLKFHDVDEQPSSNENDENENNSSSKSTEENVKEFPQENSNQIQNKEISSTKETTSSSEEKPKEKEEQQQESISVLTEKEIIDYSIPSEYGNNIFYSFTQQQSKKFEKAIPNEYHRSLVNLYTSDNFYKSVNLMLSTDFIISSVLSIPTGHLNLYSLIPKDELKQKIPEEKVKNLISFISLRCNLINVKASPPKTNTLVINKTKEIISSLFNAYKSDEIKFDKPIILYRGTRIENNSKYISDVWCRNPELPISSDTNGKFQEQLRFALKHSSSDESVFKKFYYIGKEVSCPSFLSTSISIDVANLFSLNEKDYPGYLFVIKLPKDSSILYVGGVSDYDDEEEIILKPSSSFTLLSVSRRDNYNKIKYIIDDRGTSSFPDSLIFELEYKLEPKDSLESIQDRTNNFWTNMFNLID